MVFVFVGKENCRMLNVFFQGGAYLFRIAV